MGATKLRQGDMRQGGISEKLSDPLKLIAQFKRQRTICICSIRATGQIKFFLHNLVRKIKEVVEKAVDFAPRPCFAGLEKSDINVETLLSTALNWD